MMFYVLFGIVLGHGNPVNRGETQPTCCDNGLLGVMAVALFGFA